MNSTIYSLLYALYSVERVYGSTVCIKTRAMIDQLWREEDDMWKPYLLGFFMHNESATNQAYGKIVIDIIDSMIALMEKEYDKSVPDPAAKC
jgi:hypothetical protein